MNPLKDAFVPFPVLFSGIDDDGIKYACYYASCLESDMRGTKILFFVINVWNEHVRIGEYQNRYPLALLSGQDVTKLARNKYKELLPLAFKLIQGFRHRYMKDE